MTADEELTRLRTELAEARRIWRAQYDELAGMYRTARERLTAVTAVLAQMDADAIHHAECAAKAKTDGSTFVHGGMSEGHRIDAERLRRALGLEATDG